jgi:heat shock protein HslJ
MMQRNFWAVAAVVALSAGLAACESAVSAGGSDIELTRQDWVAQSMGGNPILNPGRLTLAFAEGRVSGRGGCNHYSGAVEIGPGTLKIGALISTKMACADASMMQQESAYLNALNSAALYRFGPNGVLIISTGSGYIIYSGVPRQERPEGS